MAYPHACPDAASGTGVWGVPPQRFIPCPLSLGNGEGDTEPVLPAPDPSESVAEEPALSLSKGG